MVKSLPQGDDLDGVTQIPTYQVKKSRQKIILHEQIEQRLLTVKAAILDVSIYLIYVCADCFFAL